MREGFHDTRGFRTFLNRRGAPLFSWQKCDAGSEETGQQVGAFGRSDSSERDIVGMLEEAAGPRRFVIDTGEAKLAVARSKVRSDEAKDAVPVGITRAQIEETLARSGNAACAEGKRRNEGLSRHPFRGR